MMGSAGRVAVVYKKSLYERCKKRLSKKNVENNLFLRLIQSHKENAKTRQVVTSTLKKLGIKYDSFVYNKFENSKNYWLIIVVGGDGTLFHTAYYVKDTPIMAVNSDTTDSLALFSCATSQNFCKKIEELLARKLRITKMARLQIYLNGKMIKEPAMNDILFAHRKPAGTSRYILEIGRAKEEQRSSGIWISTAAGSTAAVRTSGGKIMNITSKKIQYVVREPYYQLSHKLYYKLINGITSTPIKITSLENNAAIYLDGGRVSYSVKFFDTITITTNAPPIKIYGYDDARRQKLFGKPIQ